MSYRKILEEFEDLSTLEDDTGNNVECMKKTSQAVKEAKNLHREGGVEDRVRHPGQTLGHVFGTFTPVQQRPVRVRKQVEKQQQAQLKEPEKVDKAADNINDNSNERFTANDGKKTKDKKSRRKHSDELVSVDPNVVKEEKPYLEMRNNSTAKKKRIKVEPDSDNDVCKKKKKIKHLETNGDQNESLELMPYDETYLNMKVKHEESSASFTTKHKKNKHKRTTSVSSSITPVKSHENNSSSEINDDNVTLKQETENDSEMSKSKKKKKSKKQYDINNQSLEMDEKMDIEETAVTRQTPTQTKNSNNNSDSFITENTTLLGESEESGCDEISAIKCDDSHSPHTISFINKSVEEENPRVNCNESLNIITKQASIVLDQDSNKKLKATKHRKQRLSDRIRFEDDDDNTNTDSSHVEHAEHAENNRKPIKLKHFLKTHPNLKLLPQLYNHNTNVTRDDEIWIIKCPRDINITDFNNTTLNIHGKCKIKLGGQTYEVSAEEEQSDTITSLLTVEQSKYTIRNVPLNGIINLRKRIPKAHFRDDNIMVNNQTNFIPLPDTKCRHPLFGSNYKKALKIPAAIAERLNVQDSEETLLRPTKRRKKKNKKERNTADQLDPQVESDTLMKAEPELPGEIREKKKKKRKMTDNEGPTPKKVKRIKHDPESAEAWESEKAIEENLFNF